MVKIRTQQDDFNFPAFKNKLPSECVPHQAMTIEEIYLSIAQGIIPDLVNYAEEDPFVSTDLTDFDDALATVEQDEDLPTEEEHKTTTPGSDKTDKSVVDIDEIGNEQHGESHTD